MIELVRKFISNNKPVVALCHGVMILAALGTNFMKGRRVGCIDTMIPDLKNAGCSIEVVDGITTFGDKGAKPCFDVVVDGNLITGGMPYCLPEALRNFYKLMGVKISIPEAMEQ